MYRNQTITFPVPVLATIARKLWATPQDLDPSEKQLLLGTSPKHLIQVVDIAELLLTRGGRAMPHNNLAQSLQQQLAPTAPQPTPKPLGQIFASGRLFTDSWPDPVANAVADECVARIESGIRVPLPLPVRTVLHNAGHSPMIAAATLAARMRRAGIEAVSFKELEDASDEFEDTLAQELVRLI